MQPSPETLIMRRFAILKQEDTFETKSLKPYCHVIKVSHQKTDSNLEDFWAIMQSTTGSQTNSDTGECLKRGEFRCNYGGAMTFDRHQRFVVIVHG
uniref:Uncharacterized protein n=1 Tax=Romanomermis culicivorax TaxID=13658 RepID=A0A915JP83_ROMCU